MPKKASRNFAREGFILLAAFWIISFIIIFYNYCTNIDRKYDMEVELMKSQSELITRTVRHEINQAVGDLSWYATNKSTKEGTHVDVSHLSEEALSDMLSFKDKYEKLMVFSLDGNVMMNIENKTHAVLLDDTKGTFTKEKLDLLEIGSDEKSVLVEFMKSGHVGLYILSSDLKSVIYLSIELGDFYDLKESVENSFHYHVRVETTNSTLFESVEQAFEECEMNHPSDESCLHFGETHVLRSDKSILVWSCLPCLEEMPYGVSKIIWMDESGVPLRNILGVSSLSGHPFDAIRMGAQKEFESVILVVFLINGIAAMILGYVYRKYRSTQNELREQATRDGLTGFLNRWAGTEVLINQMAMADRNDAALTISFVDIDGLKSVNDLYGHDDGDRLIKLIAEALKKYVREADSLVRIGGDEFFIIFPNCEGEKVNDILSRSLNWLDEINRSGPFEWKADFSYGLSRYSPNSSMTPDELVRRADQNMYLHKRSKDTTIK